MSLFSAVKLNREWPRTHHRFAHRKRFRPAALVRRWAPPHTLLHALA